ncbi:MAG: ADOP family duplicated permease [Gemmatimonadota bacterium]|jgi:predicted permease
MSLELLLAELRLAIRALARRPTLSLVVVATLGLGLGANTAVFSVLQSVLLAPLPYEDAGRLVRIYGSRRDRPGESTRMYLTNPATTELRDHVATLEGVAVLANYSPEWADVTGADAPERVRVLRVSAGYFDVLGATPVAGTTFDRTEERTDSRAVVVGEDLWERYLGGARDAIGGSLTLDGEPYTVVGVVSDAFDDPLEGRIDVWMPADLSGSEAENWDNNYLSAVARLAPGAGLDALRAELDVVEGRHDAMGEDAAEKGYAIVPLREDIVGSAEPVLAAVMGAVLFLLLLACVNVAAVMVAAGAARQRELAIRTSLGSPRRALVRLFLFEALLLAAAGGVVGVGVGFLALDGLLAVAPPGLPRLDEVALGPGAWIVAAAGVVGAGLVLGLATALPFTRPRVGRLLGGTRAGDGAPASRRIRSALVTVEVALAVVLLVGAGVLLRTVQELRHRDLGADPTGVLTFEVGLPTSRYGTEEEAQAFHAELHRRISSLPGVVAAAATTRLPVTGSYNRWGTRPATAPGEPVDMENIQVNQRWVAGDFFRAADLALLSGRLFGPQDDPESPPVVVVNRTLARTLFSGEDPVGRLLRIGGRYPRIVGVVEDEALTARGGPAPMAYHAQRQWSIRPWTLTQLVRATGDPAALVPAIRAELTRLDPDLVLFRPRPMSEVIGADIAQERFAATLLTAFATLAILLAGLGLFGILSELVGRQRHEIGVRVALGARPARVRRMVVGRGLRLTVIGIVAGVIVAAALTRVLEFLLYRVSPHDPLVFGVVPALLVVIALLSSWLPARRATAVDPVECLRGE